MTIAQVAAAYEIASWTGLTSAASTRWLSVNRQARLRALLAVVGPDTRRPRAAWFGRRFEVMQATPRALAR